VSDPAATDASRRITLRIPGERSFIGIARLFVGGLAARLDLGYETMDDLQLALESVLRKAELLDEVTLEAQLEDDGVSILVGPLGRDPLESTDRQAESLELERLLAALVAGTESSSRDDGCWLRLDVRIPAGSGSA
jgi:anti-sigma regulatory factor (Ser/Thr protein kinase)